MVDKDNNKANNKELQETLDKEKISLMFFEAVVIAKEKIDKINKLSRTLKEGKTRNIQVSENDILRVEESITNEAIINFNINESIKIIVNNIIKTRTITFKPNKKMKVIYSIEFEEKLKKAPKKQREVIEEIKEKIEQKDIIRPYLSTNNYINKVSIEDELLKKEFIYHLHLEKCNKRSQYVKRSNKLLFMTYDSKNVYFLDMMPHPNKEVWKDAKAVKIAGEIRGKLKLDKKDMKEINDELFGDSKKILEKLKNEEKDFTLKIIELNKQKSVIKETIKMVYRILCDN